MATHIAPFVEAQLHQNMAIAGGTDQDSLAIHRSRAIVKALTRLVEQERRGSRIVRESLEHPNPLS